MRRRDIYLWRVQKQRKNCITMWEMILWTSECPGFQGAQGRGEVVSSLRLLITAQLGLERTFEEKQNSDWCKLGEEDNFLAQISAPAQRVLSTLSLISTLPCAFTTPPLHVMRTVHQVAWGQGNWSHGNMTLRKDETHPDRCSLWKGLPPVTRVVLDFNYGPGLPDFTSQVNVF